VEALTDALTGLGNRRSVMIDLEEALLDATADDPRLIVLFDLDGFKSYNDTYGHPAGDELLIRLGHRLAAAAKPYGAAFRLGGDEFCVLAQTDLAGRAAVIAATQAALSETGEGFEISASQGSVLIPAEAATVAEALQLADSRMYAQKGHGRVSAGRQTRDVLLSTLRERQPHLHDHLTGVADTAVATARELAMTPEQIDEVSRAAELHDVGKMAIPDAILEKPAALDDAEWAFMRRHTIIGERILAAAPALIPVASLVRSSHERWDGGGYPDGLAGKAIPLGARVVCVCDAFDAMVSERPYRAASSRDEAFAELRHCAGSQFDPDVVEAFIAALTRTPVPVV
jgi:diguanylate cyclase (GGDEF)-like protein